MSKIVLSRNMERMLESIYNGEVIWKFKSDGAGAWRDSRNYASERTINALLKRSVVKLEEFKVLGQSIPRYKLVPTSQRQEKAEVCTLCGSGNTVKISDDGLYGCHNCGEEFRPGQPHYRFELTFDESGNVQSSEIEIPIHPKAAYIDDDGRDDPNYNPGYHINVR